MQKNYSFTSQFFCRLQDQPVDLFLCISLPNPRIQFQLPLSDKWEKCKATQRSCKKWNWNLFLFSPYLDNTFLRFQVLPGTYVPAGSSITPQVAYFINISLPTQHKCVLVAPHTEEFFRYQTLLNLVNAIFKFYLFTNLLCIYLVMVSVSQIIEFTWDIFIYKRIYK